MSTKITRRIFNTHAKLHLFLRLPFPAKTIAVHTFYHPRKLSSPNFMWGIFMFSTTPTRLHLINSLNGTGIIPIPIHFLQGNLQGVQKHFGFILNLRPQPGQEGSKSCSIRYFLTILISSFINKS